MRFEFATAGRIVFGPGVISEATAAAAAMGKNALVISGKDSERVHSLLYDLGKAGLHRTTFQVLEEPTVDCINEGVEQARGEKRDMIIAMGGGSVIDTGKAIAALLTNKGELMDYLEVVGQGEPLSEPSAPLIAIPTTAGTGAEVTRNAVIGVVEENVKVSMRHPFLLPELAVVDPELTLSLPRSVTASSGLDALTQLLEAYICRQATPLTDGFCREGLNRAARSLRRAWEDGADLKAREDMALASLLSGLALANAKLGAVHGFAAPLGGIFAVPHGMICARLLPFVMEANIEALQQENAPHSLPLAKLEETARILTGDPDAPIEAGAQWIHTLCEEMKIPALGGFGLKKGDIARVVEQALKSSSMQGNPVELDEEQLKDILEKAM